jgi:hypothetical protein
MTKADLIKEVSQEVELTRKDCLAEANWFGKKNWLGKTDGSAIGLVFTCAA